MKNIFLKSKAKSLQKTGGGDSQKNVHHLGVASEMPPRCLRDASVSIYSCQSDFSTRVWKYVACILMVLCLGIGNVWGADFSASTMATTTGSAVSDHVVVKSAYSATSSGNICNTSETIVSLSSSANAGWDTHFIEIKASGEGYTLDSPVSVTVSANKTDGSTNSIVAVFWTGDAEASFASCTTFVIPNKNATGEACGPVDVEVPSGTKTMRIYRQIKYVGTEFSSSKGYTTVGFGSAVYVKQVTATASGSGGGGGSTPSIDLSEGTVNVKSKAGSAFVTATTTLTGSNLTNGTYNVTTSASGLSISPTSFTVSGGSVSQEFTVSYTGSSSGSESISFSDGTTSTSLTANYSTQAVSSDATLSSVTIGGVTATLAGSAGSYTAKIDRSDKGFSMTQDVAFTTSDANATVKLTNASGEVITSVTGHNFGSGNLVLYVLAEDGSTNATYTVSITTYDKYLVYITTSTTPSENIYSTLSTYATAHNYKLSVWNVDNTLSAANMASNYDLVILAEAPGSGKSTAQAVGSAIGNVPVLNFKAFMFGKTNWPSGAGNNLGAGENAIKTATALVPCHTIYNNLSLTGASTTVTFLSSDPTAGSKNGVQAISGVSAFGWRSLAKVVKDETTYSALLEYTGTAGANKAIVIPISDNACANISTATQTIIGNAVAYLLDNTALYTINTTKTITGIHVAGFTDGAITDNGDGTYALESASGINSTDNAVTVDLSSNCASYSVDYSGLTEGYGDVTITVTAESGAEGTYTLTVTATTPSGYAITKASATNGTIAVTDGTDAINSAETGDKVYIAATPNTGYAFDGWSVYKTGDESTIVSLDADDDADAKTRTFDMPAYGVTVNATFNAIDYTITHNAAENGSYTIKVADAAAVSTNTTANFGQTVVLAAAPASGYKFSAWDVYKTGEPSTKVTVTNNQFTMPDYAVSVSATFAEATELYDYSVMENKSFTGETVDGNQTGKSKTFGSEGNPQLVVENAGWDSKDNIINSFIKFFGGTSSMSVVIPTGRKATVTIKYGSYNTGRYLLVNGTEQTHPLKALDNDITTSNIDTYMPTVELTNQTGTLVLTSQSNNSGNNIYFAYVDVTLTGNASYGVTYHLNDGAWDGDAGAVTYTYGTGIAPLATNVTRDYYDFAGWYGNEGLTGDAITSIADNATGDKELWAKWTPKSYTLTWSWDGGSCSATAGTHYTAGGSVAYGTALVYPDAATMSKDDAAFAGWSTSAETMPAEALTITALWAPEHAISYTELKGNDVSAYPTSYVEGVGVASFEDLADVENFHFTGWSPASIGTEATTDQTITAQWVAAYNVTFNAGEGSGTVPATFQKWATATFELPGQESMVAPAGKVFIGWKVNGAGETRAEGYEYTMTAAAVEFEAQWKAVTLLINYDGENYSLNTDKFVIYEGTALQDEDYTVQGTDFDVNFKFGNTCSSTPFAGTAYTNRILAYDVTTNNTDITLYLYNGNGSNKKLYYQIVYEGASAGSVQTVTVNGNQGKVVEIPNIQTNKGARVLFGIDSKDVRVCQIEVEENGTALPAFGTNGYQLSIPGRAATEGKAITFDGFEFKTYSDLKFISGQNNAPLRGIDGTNYIKFTAPANIQLQVTTANSQKFYVCAENIGDAEKDTQYGGSASAHNINLHAGTYYIVPTASGSGGEVQITKLAFATAPDAVTVTFDSKGGSSVAAQDLFSGEKAVAPTAPTKSGYRFVKWQLSGEDYNFSTPVTTDIDLDAVWQKTWTVTFDSDGGSAVAAQVVDDDDMATIPDPAPTKAGNEFAGWYYGDPAAVYNFATLVTADLTLTAHWTPLDNDASISALTYDGNDIDISSGTDFAYVLPYKAEFDDEKLAVTKSALSASVGEITYSAGVASFTVTAGDGTTTQDYTVTFTNGPKDLLCLVWAEMKGDGVIELDEEKSALSIDVAAGANVKGSYDYGGYTGYKFNNTDAAYIELKDGNFKSGDKVDVFITKKIDAIIPVFKANEATDANRVAVTDENMKDGVNTAYLTADAASLYLRRGNDYSGWNPYVAYVAVYRAYPVPVVKSISFNGAAGAIDGTTITATIPYTTDMASLPIEATFMSNDPGNTSGDVGGLWVDNDGVYTNTYVVTDKDGDTNTYTITLTRATVSHDASLTALAVEGYEISFAPATLSYDVQLPYGATVGDLPAVTYTAAPAATADKTDAAEMPGYTTIAVTAEDGATVQEYKIYFHANQIPTLAVFDGRTMDAAVVEYTDATSGLSWTNEGAATSASNNAHTINGRAYTKSVKIFGSATAANRYLKITVPENYMAKFYLAGSTNSSTGSETLFFASELTADPTKAIAGLTSDEDHPTWVETDYLFPDEYYFCVTGSARIYELSVTLYHIDYTRSVTEGRIGTICLPKGGTIRGAAVYEVAYFNPDNQKIYYDEVLSGEMEPGMPYVFMPDEGNNDQLVVMCGNNVPAAVAGHKNGLYGSFTQELLTKDDGNYIFSANKYWFVNSDEVYVGENRAYLKVADIYGYNNEPIPPVAHGRRRISMDAGAHAPQVTTGVESISDEGLEIKGAQKMLINGKIYILRGEKMYDATGRLVK